MKNFRKILLVLFILLLATTRFLYAQYRTDKGIHRFIMHNKDYSMNISSSEFSNNEDIPEKYTCDGDDFSPPLTIENIPKNAKSMALIVEDPDAPGGTFTHWVIFNISPNKHTLKNNIPPTVELPDGSIQGINDFGKVGYGGPCPPSGTHRYKFQIYALDKMLDLKAGVNKDQVKEAMKNHVLSKAELIGLYNRNQ